MLCGVEEGKVDRRGGKQRSGCGLVAVGYVESRTQRKSVVNQDNFLNSSRGLKISKKVIRGLVLLFWKRRKVTEIVF